jgi:RNA recognition motif-containing protein
MKEKVEMGVRLYVGNLPVTVDERQLAELFAPFGTVVEVMIAIDRTTSLSEGFGFVQMSSDAAAREAIAGLNLATIGDRTIVVHAAKPRPGRSSATVGERANGDLRSRRQR